MSINRVFPSLAALPTTLGVPGGAVAYIKIFHVIIQWKVWVSPKVAALEFHRAEFKFQLLS
jgi:hypothetical protein